MLTAREQEIYRILGTLSVPLEQSPQLGLIYLSDKMLDCRQKQDQVQDLLLEVNQDFSRVRQALRSQKALALLLRNSSHLREYEEAQLVLQGLENEEEGLRALVESVKAKSSNLRMTSSDIRLLTNIVEQQMKNGGVPPPSVARPSPVTVAPSPEPQPTISEPAVVNTVADLLPDLGTVPAVASPPQTVVESGFEANEIDVNDFLNS